MTLTNKFGKIAAAILATICLTACSTQNMTIPIADKISITDAADTLGITVADFEAFLDNIDTTYDTYINNLNKNNQTLDDVKKNIEDNYDCTFKDYVDTIIIVNNKEIPNSDEYTSFKSEYSVFDAYIRNEDLDDKKQTLVNYDVSIEIAENADDVYAFDIMQTCNSDFRTYVDTISKKYGCKSVEFNNMAIFGGHGVAKPAETNPCMDRFFVYEDETGEILDKLIVSVLTMRFDDKNKNITLALSNELGLLFKTTGADSQEKMLKISDLKFQIRNADHN